LPLVNTTAIVEDGQGIEPVKEPAVRLLAVEQ